MKLLTSLQQNQISGGGIVSIIGTQYYINTIGIPQNCVTLFESTLNTGLTESIKPNSTDESIKNAMAPYLDQHFDTGCVKYIGTLADNFDNRIKIG